MNNLTSKFCHLHLHTEYSLLDGAIRLNDLFKKCHEYGMDSVAITDHGTMHGAAEFYEKANKAKASIKPIIGCEVYVAPRTIKDNTPTDHKGLSHLVLLAKNSEGYSNLCKLVSIAQLKGFYYKPRVDKELLAEFSDGLIAMSACLKGELAQLVIQNQIEKADERAQFFVKTFGENNFFLEIQQNGIDVQNKVNKGLWKMSKRLSIPIVATNDCHYLSKKDVEAHEILLCVQTGKTINDPSHFKFDSDQLYFKSSEEMVDSFGDFPGAVETTLKIAQRCNVEFDDKTYHFPRFDNGSLKSEDDIFKNLAWEGFTKKIEIIKSVNPDIDEKLYKDRLEYEIDTILKMGFPGYFLIVADFIRYAKEIDVPVGPGRGSAAGSMVAYVMGITDLDPIEHGLIFERFLNPSRMSMPDIDVDFCIEGREKIYDYVVDRYGGGQNVCQIITFGRLKAKAVIRDVGRALDVPLPEVDQIAKLIPDNVKNLQQAIDDIPQIKEKASESEIKEKMLEVALVLEGLPRHASTHAAGVVISDKPLVNYLPLYKGKEGETVTQFDMNFVEKIGLVKFDFLGLRNLTVIKNTIELLKKNSKQVPDLSNLDPKDKKTFKLLESGDTTGVFQLESSGMKDLIKKLKPETFNDIVALVALYRPGPLESGMADNYVERKHGRQEVVYLFDQLEPILKETYGVILYQEQVMKIAAVLANYSMADADGLRKAMGKKIQVLMEAHRELFMKGAKENDLDQQKAKQVFDLMEKFGGYGFNKSHSAAYALISYQTAYLKANYPLEFIAALMTSEMSTTDNIIKYIEECKAHDIEVLKPDVNSSDIVFAVLNNAITYGLAAVKNVGQAAVEEIISARKEEKVFNSIFDFCEKVNLSKVNKRVFESLIKCGAFDSLKSKRSQMMAILEEALEHGSRIQKEKNDAQLDLFADTDVGADITSRPPELPDMEEWEENDLLFYEKESLGFYFSGHPLKKYSDVLQKYCNASSLNINDFSDGKTVRIGGFLKLVKAHKTKKGDMMAFASIDDGHGIVEIVVFPNLYVDTHQLIADEEPVILEGEIQKKESSVNLIAQKIIPIDNAEEEWTASVVISIDQSLNTKENLEKLKSIFSMYPGKCSSYIAVKSQEQSDVLIKTSDEFKVSSTKEFFKEVDLIFGENSIKTTCAPVKQSIQEKRWHKKSKPKIFF
ncbi:MAG: DNA polymerase III subunit alpha [Desulfobacterales bacterium]|nr:DNA polymerase III subunit alpha [Desulfobacterales bacterium]